MRSNDGGKTWLDPQHVAHHGDPVPKNPLAIKQKLGLQPEPTVNNPICVVDQKSGRVTMLYCVEYSRCFAIHSDDDGATFSKPRDITAAVEKLRDEYPWFVVGIGPGHGIQLKSGRLIAAIWLSTGEGGNAHRLEEWINPTFLPIGMQHLLYTTWWAAAWLAGEVKG